MTYLIKLNNDLLEPKHNYPEYKSLDSFPNSYIIGEYDGLLNGYTTWELDDTLLEGSTFFHIANGKKLPYNPFTSEMAPNRDKANRIEIVYTPEQVTSKNNFKKFIYKLYINDITELKLNNLKQKLFPNPYEFDLFNNIKNGNSELLESESLSRGITSEDFMALISDKIKEYNTNSIIIFNEKTELLNKLLNLSNDETEVSDFLINNNLIYR